jgi:hypothetical protein
VSLAPRRALGALLTVALVAPLLSACASNGDISDPLRRKMSYFSHINGDDIRATCQPGAADRMRLTFNGRYQDQVRIYDLQHTDDKPVLNEKVLSDLIINQGFTLSSLVDSLSGTDSQTPLTDSKADALWQTMVASGALTPATPGQRLESDSLWWMATGCHSGQTFFHVWEQTEQSGPPPFFDMIRALDASDLAWPAVAPPPVTTLNSPRDYSEKTHFVLETTASGLKL